MYSTRVHNWSLIKLHFKTKQWRWKFCRHSTIGRNYPRRWILSNLRGAKVTKENPRCMRVENFKLDFASSYIFTSCKCVEGPRPESNNQPRWTSARRAPSARLKQCSRASLKRFALLTLVALWPTSVRLLPSSISLWSTVRTVIRRLFHPAGLVFSPDGFTVDLSRVLS